MLAVEKGEGGSCRRTPRETVACGFLGEEISVGKGERVADCAGQGVRDGFVGGISSLSSGYADILPFCRVVGRVLGYKTVLESVVEKGRADTLEGHDDW